MRILHTVFHSGCTNLHSDQQSIRVLISPYPHQHLLSPIFLTITILTGLRFWFSSPDDQWYWAPFQCICHLYVFFGKISIQICCPIFNLFVFYYWVVWVICILWILTSYHLCNLKIFSLIAFSLLMVSFTVKNFTVCCSFTY